MSPTTEQRLEKKGFLTDFLAVELLHEAAVARLSGTFRFFREHEKRAVYLEDGMLVYAASNARSHRFADKLADWGLISAADLTGFENLPEPELTAKLREAGKIETAALAASRSRFVSEIVSEILTWTTGQWIFTPLARVRGDLRVAIDLTKLLIAAARNLPLALIAERIDGESETIVSMPDATNDFVPTPFEMFVLSRIVSVTNANEVAVACGLPNLETRQAIYVLWLARAIRRFNYKTVFDENALRQILSAKLTAVKNEVAAPQIAESDEQSTKNKPQLVAEPVTIESTPVEKVVDEKFLIEEYLRRVEAAENYYQVLGVGNNAEASEIKQIYFKAAKQFHPDRFHYIGGDIHARLQNAFTHLAQAYETLKDKKTRELYDFKLRKQGGTERKEDDLSRLAPDKIYERAVDALREGKYNEAVALLTRAVQLNPNNAEYHARFGQALSVNPKFRHQAEAEMQTAIRLESDNPDWRLLLAEYYIAIGLKKRAEAELNRVLSQHPNNPAARQMFAQLR
jgi:tetratricopeptide (TPR) repeat protein